MGRGEGERGGGGLKVRPFERLAGLKGQLPDAGTDRTPEETPSPPRLRAPRAATKAQNDALLLEQVLADVEPLTERRRVNRSAEVDVPELIDDEVAARAYLRDLVDGVVPFDIADTDEFIEGGVHGLDRRIMRKLRRGHYSVQDHVDLHGMKRDEARDAVARFIRKAAARGLRCVLIVHGRGLNSKDQIPVLKEKLKAWLTRGSIGERVLAFATARPYDGGAGAVYVLLRK